MNKALYLGLVLLLVYIVASVTKFVVGAALHLLLVLAVIFLLAWGLRRVKIF